MTDAEAVAAARKLTEVVDGLRQDVKEATVAFEKSSRRTRWFVIGLAILVIAVGGVALQNHSTASTVAEQTAISKAQAACLRTYNNAVAARSTALLQPNIDQQLALADAFRSLLPFGQPKTPTQVGVTEQKFLIYLQKSDAYQNLVQTNPLPLAPKYAC